MIKHGKIYPVGGKHGMRKSHLNPIRKFVTRGMADAKENITISPLACDMRGSKQFDGQQCIIAKCLSRSLHPQAVAVGRAVAYAVFDGVAIRFAVPKASREIVEEFDMRGRVKRANIKLYKINPAWRLRMDKRPRNPKELIPGPKRRRAQRIGVRAVGGGVA